MNGYSKIGLKTNPTAKSRSIDFSDLSFSPPQTPKYPKPTFRSQQDQADSNAHDSFSVLQEEEGGDGGERFGVILSRNCSSASQRFRACERSHSSTLQAVVKRAFSMRKPSSLADGYWRIHDTAEGDGDADVEMQQQQQQQQQQHVSSSGKKKRGKILKACKRFFGF